MKSKSIKLTQLEIESSLIVMGNYCWSASWEELLELFQGNTQQARAAMRAWRKLARAERQTDNE
jgi:hypothetical protein